MLQHFFYIFVFIFCASCTHFASNPNPWTTQPKHSVSLMSYNVENLFDTQFDKGTEDCTYLPKILKNTAQHIACCQAIRSARYKRACHNLNWTKAVLKAKLENLAQVIRQVNNGKGPDIVILSEVENKSVLKQLLTHLDTSQYRIIHKEGFDKRGIDVAFLSRLPLLSNSVTLHRIPFKGKTQEDQKFMNRSRGILEASFILPNNKILTLYGIHFPSPRNPSYWREQAVNFLDKIASQPPADRVVVAGGDFNISKREEKAKDFFSKTLSKNWFVSHIVGCEGCQGTYVYRNTWSFLDALLLRKQGQSWSLSPSSISIPCCTKEQSRGKRKPKRYNPYNLTGASDHFPVYMRLINNTKYVQQR